ncbi:MAG: gliding motility-associated C-terminal domain-containing protein [Prolixibacteraceae bacterium]
MYQKLVYLFVIFVLTAVVQAAGQDYVIDKVCVGSERQYRVEGETGSIYEWLVYNDAGVQQPVTNSSGTNFVQNNPDGSLSSGSEISILWNKPGLYDLAVVQTSFLGCDTLEQGQVEVWAQPLAIAGNPLSICSGSKVLMTEALASNYSSLIWTSSGDGYFDNPTELNTGYNGGPADLALGKVKLTLSAIGMVDNGTCSLSSSTLTATFKEIPKLVIHDPAPVCIPGTIDLSAPSVTAGSDPGLVLEYFTDAFATVPLTNYKAVNRAGTYYILATNADDCSVLKTVNVSFDNLFIPSFAEINELCLNSTPPELPLASFNGITGSWNPATVSTSALGITSYTFTPKTGQCASDYTIQIEVSNSIIPRFSLPDSYCLGSLADPLPLVSNNGIIGTWSPASILTNSLGTSAYIFTPDPGQCGVTLTKNIAITKPSSLPVFTFPQVLCLNSIPPKLPTVSDDGINGTWNPSVITTNQIGFKDYTFTPASGQCVDYTVKRITIENKIDPQFAAIGPYCLNSVPPDLPKTSANGISGTWSPATIATNKPGNYVYTFTPNPGECALSASAIIEIYEDITVNAKAEPLTVFGGKTKVTVTATGGSGNYVSGTGVFNRGSGTHRFTVTDDLGCSGFKEIYINDPQDFDVTVTVLGEIKCTGGAQRLEVTASGGTEPYTIKLTGGNSSYTRLPGTNTFFVSASALPYVFEITDANGMFARSDQIEVTDPPLIDLSVLSTSTSCAGESNGSATVVASLGEKPYTYLWNDPQKQTTPTAINLKAGTYVVEVSDVNGCTPVKKSVVVSDPPIRTLAAVGVNPICPESDGSIELTFTNVPDGQYDILYDFSVFSNVLVVDNAASVTAPAGIYKNLRISIGGCNSASGVSVVLTDPPKQLISEFIMHPNCNTITGSLVVTTPANNSGFIYSVDNGTYRTSGSFSGLIPGSHLIRVKNLITGCETEKSVTINPVPDPPEIPLATIDVQASCIDPFGGVSILSPLGSAYQYSSDGIYFQVSPVFKGLVPGTYTFTVMDLITKCKSESSPVTLDPVPNPPAVVASVKSQPDCVISTGTIEFTGTLSSNYEYSIDGITFGEESLFENLTPGKYSPVIKELSTGCEFSLAILTVNPVPFMPAMAEASVTVQTSCTVTEGTILVSNPLGVDYEYSNDGLNYQTSPQFTNLPAGTYPISVRHRISLCESMPISLTIDQFPPVPADIVAVPLVPECEESPVQTMDANAGIVQPPLGIMVRWYDDAGIPVTNPVLNKPGTVTYLAEAVNGVCVSNNRTPVTLTMIQAPEVLVSQNPYEVCEASPVQTINANSVVSVQSGVTLKWYDAPTGGNLIANPVLNVVGTKSYYAEMYDGKCSSPLRTEIILTIHPLPEIPVAEITNLVNCKDEKGSILITSPVGAGFEYSLDGSAYQASPVFTDLSSQSHEFRARNILTGCESLPGKIILPNAPLPPVIKNVTVEDCRCYGDSGAINFEFENIADGTYVVIYLAGKFQNVKVVNNKAQVKAVAGRYDILAIEANGCTSEQVWNVELTQPDRLFASAEITKIDLKSQQQGEIALSISGGTGNYNVNWAANPESGFLGAVTENIYNLKDGDYAVTITDQNGCQWLDTLTIPLPNLPPVAMNDEFHTTCSRATGNLLYSDNGGGFDYDPDNDAFNIDTDPVSAPSHGYLILYADGTFQYQAVQGYSGDDSFKYTIVDIDNNYSIPATVLIHVVADFDGDGIADAVDIDTDGDGILNIYEGDPLTDTDSDGLPDYMDIDADGDGITDNVEAQTSADYVAPSNLDVNHNGLDDAYDELQFKKEIKPVDTDLDGIPDLIDFDSDNDLVPDYIEGHDADSNGKSDYLAVGKDSDYDGLDDAYDIVLNECNALDNSTGSNAAIQDFDGDGAPDWRDDNDDDDQYLTRFEDLNADNDFSNDDMDFDGHPEYLDYGRECDLMVPDAFSPNGDNIHEYFQVYCIDHFPNAVMYIFDSFGNKLFEKENYGNLDRWGSPDRAWWNGKSENRLVGDRNGKVPPGTYYYVLKLGNGEVKKSFVFISY